MSADRRVVHILAGVTATDPNADREVDFDDVRLDATAVPEPATLAMALIGPLALGAARHATRPTAGKRRDLLHISRSGLDAGREHQ